MVLKNDNGPWKSLGKVLEFCQADSVGTMYSAIFVYEINV